MPSSAPATQVRNGELRDAAACAAIVTGLPEFFTPDVADQVRADFAAHQAWVIQEGDAVTGFVIAERRGSQAAEILWAAVSAGRRGEGLGTTLLEQVLDDLSRRGVLVVEVKTLDPAAGYAPYAATWAFWADRGFVLLDTIDPLPGWQPGNPCAVLVAALGVTTGGRPG